MRAGVILVILPRNASLAACTPQQSSCGTERTEPYQYAMIPGLLQLCYLPNMPLSTLIMALVTRELDCER
jgi:hypothetical protein